MSKRKSSLMAARSFGIKGMTKDTSESEILKAMKARTIELAAELPEGSVELETEGPSNIEPESVEDLTDIPLGPSGSSTDVQEIERTVTTSKGEVFTTREGRTPRSHEDRTVSTRPSDAWIPASIIPSPIQQDGWVFYWVRTSMLGQVDNTNVSKKIREGWTPVRLQDHPELKLEVDFNSRWAKQGNVEMGGLLLCKIPEERIIERRKYHASKARQQMETVDQNYMQQNDSRMPLLGMSHGSRTEFRRD